MEEKQFCYRYVDGHDSEGRPTVMLWKQVIISETEKTFWYCPDYPHMSLEVLRQYQDRPGNRQVKRARKGADRSKYHYTKEEALRAFVYRKMYQLEKIQLTEETVRLCLKGLREAGMIEGGYRCVVHKLPEGELFTAAKEPGPIAAQYSWGEY